jgi:hypothetical protein
MQGALGQLSEMRSSTARLSNGQLAKLSGQQGLYPYVHGNNRRSVKRGVECSAAANIKLPATHLQASEQALEQLKSTKTTNRKCHDRDLYRYSLRSSLPSPILLGLDYWLTLSYLLVSCRLCHGKEEQHHLHWPHHT